MLTSVIPLTNAINRALKLRIPFALYRLPGRADVEFFADDCRRLSQPSVRQFEIGEWLAPYSRRIVIRDILSAEDLLTLSEPIPYEPVSTQFEGCLSVQSAELEETKPAESQEASISKEESQEASISKEESQEASISKEEYLKAVGEIIERCRQRNGKTVYSRMIPGRNPRLDLPKAAEQLFEAFPDAFGFLYYTPQTGCWLGATPEALLNSDIPQRRISTMALAGTRSATAGAAPWDSKNIHENLIVADYICRKLSDLGVIPDVQEPVTVTYGNLQHICRHISGELPQGVDYSEVLDSINPTPALCGTPLEAAVADISELEPHQRHCYGGFLAIHETNRQFQSFVNLRSCRITSVADGSFQLFAGGGIIAESDPETEWAETQAKVSGLLHILSPTPSIS